MSVLGFKPCGSAFGGPVGSIPTHFRQVTSMSPSKPRKPKPFTAEKEVKRRARLAVGAPKASVRHEGPKQKPPKHKQRELDLEIS